ncbi:MAG: FtsH protease activity modulator HflK [Lachnospiraceae bacterium]|nr:FtsH protease activity modulator HflK [Lachnospiraceae bacterium]
MGATYTYDPQKNDQMKTFGRIAKIAVAVIVVLILLFGSFYTIGEQEQAVLTTFGVAKSVTESGLHFKIPFVQEVEKVNTTIQGFSIGYDANDVSIEDESLMITSDYNFVNVDFYLEYRISDPVKAVYSSDDPVAILKTIAQSCIRTTIGSYDVDNVLTSGKNEIQAEIRQMIMDKLTIYDIGVQLVNITIQDAEPPTTAVMEAFKAVESAKQGKETSINNANKYRNEKLPAAEAEVDRILQDAEATKAERTNEATGQVARFNAMYEEYVKYPTVTKLRMFYETMEDVLPNMKIVVNGADGNAIEMMLPLDDFNQTTISGMTN